MNTNLCKIVPLTLSAPNLKSTHSLVDLGHSKKKKVFQTCNTCHIGDTKPCESREGIISSDSLI